MQELMEIYGATEAGRLVFLVAVLIAAIMLATLVFSFAVLIVIQVVSIFLLLTGLSSESIEDFHQYTQSILRGDCPDLLRLQELAELPASVGAERERRELLQKICLTLEECEPKKMGREIIRELRKAAA